MRPNSPNKEVWEADNYSINPEVWCHNLTGNNKKEIITTGLILAHWFK